MILNANRAKRGKTIFGMVNCHATLNDRILCCSSFGSYPDYDNFGDNNSAELCALLQKEGAFETSPEGESFDIAGFLFNPYMYQFMVNYRGSVYNLPYFLYSILGVSSTYIDRYLCDHVLGACVYTVQDNAYIIFKTKQVVIQDNAKVVKDSCFVSYHQDSVFSTTLYECFPFIGVNEANPRAPISFGCANSVGKFTYHPDTMRTYKYYTGGHPAKDLSANFNLKDNQEHVNKHLLKTYRGVIVNSIWVAISIGLATSSADIFNIISSFDNLCTEIKNIPTHHARAMMMFDTMSNYAVDLPYSPLYIGFNANRCYIDSGTVFVYVAGGNAWKGGVGADLYLDLSATSCTEAVMTFVYPQDASVLNQEDIQGYLDGTFSYCKLSYDQRKRGAAVTSRMAPNRDTFYRLSDERYTYGNTLVYDKQRQVSVTYKDLNLEGRFDPRLIIKGFKPLGNEEKNVDTPAPKREFVSKPFATADTVVSKSKAKSLN